MSEETTEQPTEEKKSILERAEEMKKYIDDKEKVIKDRIDNFERRIAESVLSGRAEVITTKTQGEKDKEESEAIVKRMLG